jgi:oxygen-independent coproporphyrinogen-3 oxidase
MNATDQGGFGLYVHWPFCQAKCPYCDFNSHVAAEIDQSRWKNAYLSEIKRVSSDTRGRTLSTVFFGGGTPSLMAPDTVAEVIEAVRAAWPVSNSFEVTLEANPTSVEAGRFRAFRDAGVNRVSIGVQALVDDDLRRLGRLHSAAEAKAAVRTGQSVFDRVSFDLIYARQYQTLEAWRAELTDALGFGVDHLSLYQLTIEPNTAFGDRFAKGRLPGLIDEDRAADMFDLTQDLCDRAGLSAYEVSNHAADMAQSQHNLIYWRGGDYIGIGPGAHGRLTLDGWRYATETPLSPGAWLDAVTTHGSGEARREALTAQDWALEYLLMAMRLSEGLSMNRLSALSGGDLDEAVLDELADLRLIERTDSHLKATVAGRRVLNAVTARLADALPG